MRGLWDADTDQIIFGTHQVAYRAGNGKTLFPREISREFTFLPYAQISEFRLNGEIGVTEAFYVPHGPKHDRVVAFVVDITVHNSGREPTTVSVFPWAMLIGQRFYGEPEREVRAGAGERFIRSVNEDTGAVRWWGGSRTPDVTAVSVREQTLLDGIARGSLRASVTSRRGDAATRRGRPAAGSSARSNTGSRSSRARASRCGLRSCSTRTATRGRGPRSSSCSPTPRHFTTPSVITPKSSASRGC